MKRVISIIAAITSIFILSISAGAEQSAPPAEGLKLWLEAGEEQFDKDTADKINKWLDKSGNAYELVQDENNSRRPVFIETATGLKTGGAVKFVSNQYLIKKEVNYSGNASIAIYFKLNNCLDGQTLFSSSEYIGEAVTTAGKIPFSIAFEDGGLVFKMSDSVGDIISNEMNVSLYDEDGNLKEYMMLIVTISGKTVNVYSSEHSNQSALTEPVATFNLANAPYWQSYAYGLSYDTLSRIKGIQGEIAESMIYEKALSLDEVNELQKYIKLKYENPVISKIYMKNTISELPKNKLAEPIVVGVGNLMGEEIEIPVTDFTLESSNPDSIIILNGKIKTIGFGGAVITISYPGVESVSFSVTVPQLTINDILIDDILPGEETEIKWVVENIAEQKPVSLMMVAGLYKGNSLVDVKTDIKEEFIGEEQFDAKFVMPADTAEHYIHVSIVYADTLAPVANFTK